MNRPTRVALLLGFVVALAAALVAPGPRLRAQDLPKMQFNDVKEVAPGVWFRYSSISATDQSVPFGGSNNIWVVFDDFVVVIDANFPKEAKDVLTAIRKTTDKPVRYVLDTHHHGDHAYGNGVWAKEGATIVGQFNCFRLMTTVGPNQYKLQAETRKDVAETPFKAPTLVFDDKLVLDDGKQRVEFLFLGHAHTAGDAVAYLPKHKILCTGDACVNGAFNYMGHSDSKSWIKVLERMEQLDVALICPGHGPVAGKDLLKKQRRYFEELRAQVRQGVDAGRSLKDITAAIDMPWYKEWTGKEAKKNEDNVAHVYGELTGKIDPSKLGLRLDLPEGESYCRATPGWTPPRRVVVPNLAPARLARLREAAPSLEFVIARSAEEAARLASSADALLGFGDPAVLVGAGQVKWVHVPARPGGDGEKAPGRGGRTVTQLLREGRDAASLADLDSLLMEENVRRFADGRRLLGVVR